MQVPGHQQPANTSAAELSALEAALRSNDPASRQIVEQAAQRLTVLVAQIHQTQSLGVVREQFELLQAVLNACHAAQQVLARYDLPGQANHLSRGIRP